MSEIGRVLELIENLYSNDLISILYRRDVEIFDELLLSVEKGKIECYLRSDNTYEHITTMKWEQFLSIYGGGV